MADNVIESVAPKGYKRSNGAAPPDYVGKSSNDVAKLYFPLDARALRTPFRDKVLQLIYEIGRRELGDHLKMVDVFVDHDPYVEPDRVALFINFLADLSNEESIRVEYVIDAAVFEPGAPWTEDEMADILETIDYGINPVPSIPRPAYLNK